MEDPRGMHPVKRRYDWTRYWYPRGAQLELTDEGLLPDPTQLAEGFVNRELTTLDLPAKATRTTTSLRVREVEPRMKVDMATPATRAALEERIIRDPAVMGGEAVLRGTRVPLRTVLASLAAGDAPEEILDALPTLTADDVRAVIAFAAASAEEDLPVPPLPARS